MGARAGQLGQPVHRDEILDGEAGRCRQRGGAGGDHGLALVVDQPALEDGVAVGHELGLDLVGVLEQGRRQFLALVEHVRPELHRYCTRMTGSVFDGEDVVQETLAKAYFALAEMESTPPLRPWLFRIASRSAFRYVRTEKR